MMSVHDFLHLYDSTPCPDCIFLRPAVNKGTTASKIRFLREAHFHYINNGGWHFTSLGGISALRNKLKVYAHQERSFLLSKSPEEMEATLFNGTDPLIGRRVFFCVIEKGFPQYICDNIERFRPYIMDPATMGKRRWGRNAQLRLLVFMAIIVGTWNRIKYGLPRFARRLLPY